MFRYKHIAVLNMLSACDADDVAIKRSDYVISSKSVIINIILFRSLDFSPSSKAKCSPLAALVHTLCVIS